MAAVSASSRQTSAELLGRAVHRSDPLSVDGLLERLFTFAFRDLVYPMIWEDPVVDLAALELADESRVAAVASGGCNALAYLTAAPARIFCVDLNRAHVALNRLRHEAIRRISDHAVFFEMFGHAALPGNVATYERVLRDHLDAATREYWEGRDLLGRRRIECFARGFYRYGLLGRFIGAAHLAARLYGKNPARLARSVDVEEQKRLFEAELAPLFDSRVIRWVLGHRAALYGLGIPPAQYAALVGDAGHMADVVRDRLRKLACDFDIKGNPFAWMAFARGFALAGGNALPVYLRAEHFPLLKARVERVSIELVSMTEFLSRQPAHSLDRYVLLDAQDWMDGQEVARLWTEITRTARPGARVIFRTAGRDTILPGRVPAAILDRWRYEAERSKELHCRDRSAIYGGFHLYVLR
jgi:S-adenosylmethionine-diacylglycerol 3-amino-3-carboxypropyl transferase